jgi:CHASE2 domain-containing sensor protein
MAVGGAGLAGRMTRPRLKLGLIAAGLITLGLGILSLIVPTVAELESSAGDLRTALLSRRAEQQHAKLAVVQLNLETLKAHAGHGYILPPDRALLARLVAAIDQAGASTIGVNFVFLDATEKEKDEALIAALRGAKAKVIMGAVGEDVRFKPAELAFQRDFLAKVGRPVGHVYLRYDKDRVLRATPPSEAGSGLTRSFAELVADGVAPSQQLAAIGGFVSRVTARPSHRIDWLKQPASGEDLFRTVSASALLEAHANPAGDVARLVGSLIAGRAVLLGSDIDAGDRHFTAFSTSRLDLVPAILLGGVLPTTLTGLDVQAQLVAQKLDRRTRIVVPQILEWPSVFLLTIIGFAIGMLFRLQRFVYVIGISILVAIDAWIYSVLSLVMPPYTLPLAAWMAGTWCGRHAELLDWRQWLQRGGADQQTETMG